MESGTAIGLLVGGAILILAARPRTNAAGQVLPGPGGSINPLNWFGAQQQAPAAPMNFPQAPAQPASSPAASPRFSNANYTGAQSPYNQQAYSPMGSPAYGSPSFQQASYSPSYSPSGGGYQYAANTNSSAAYSPTAYG